MATITERNFPSGVVTYQMRIRRKGKPTFSLTFDDRDAAVQWVEENEKLFLQDPEWYFRWREELYYDLQRTNQCFFEHIRKPLTPFT